MVLIEFHYLFNQDEIEKLIKYFSDPQFTMSCFAHSCSCNSKARHSDRDVDISENLVKELAH